MCFVKREGAIFMLTEEAKKILLANLHTFTPIVQDAAQTILSEFENLQKKFADVTGESKNLIGEIWKDIPGYEGLYQVSNFLRVKSLRWQGGRIMKARINEKGYPCLSLYKNGVTKFFGVHILAARAFIPNPENKPLVHHKNSNPATCTVDELEWVTYSENEFYAFKSGRKKGMPGSTNPAAKLDEAKVDFILKNYIPCNPNFGGKALAEMFGVTRSTISDIVNKKIWNSKK